MNWDAIGAIGEIVGALAVVLSLIYLAWEKWGTGSSDNRGDKGYEYGFSINIAEQKIEYGVSC